LRYDCDQNQHGSAWFNLRTLSTDLQRFSVSDFEYEFLLLCGFQLMAWRWSSRMDPAGTGSLGYTGNGQNLAYGTTMFQLPAARKCD